MRKLLWVIPRVALLLLEVGLLAIEDGEALARLAPQSLVHEAPGVQGAGVSRQFARLRGGYVAQVANRYLFPSGSCLPAARTTREGKGRRSSALLAPRSLCTGGRPLLPVRSGAE